MRANTRSRPHMQREMKDRPARGSVECCKSWGGPFGIREHSSKHASQLCGPIAEIAQACGMSALRLCRRPRCSDCYEKLIGKFEVAVQAICADLPEAKPQSTEKAAEWDKAYGDAYTTQQMCLDSFNIDQPDAVQNLRKWFAPGEYKPFPTHVSSLPLG